MQRLSAILVRPAFGQYFEMQTRQGERYLETAASASTGCGYPGPCHTMIGKRAGGEQGGVFCLANIAAGSAGASGPLTRVRL
ncbi:MAG TPA: hypothetical protein DEP05_01935 [Betaproteobacteria bacterium]|nr:hypothetical protein [Betaproteobacteria bacterium]